MHLASRLVSIIFHPLFILLYAFLTLLLVNPHIFSVHTAHDRGLVIIIVFLMSVFFPMVCIAMMRGLNLINSLEMEDRMERIGPLIATSLFYLWLYFNVRNNPLFPPPYAMFVLGAAISLFLAFFINNFSKISLHAVGISGLLMIVILIRFRYSYDSFFVNLGPIGTAVVHPNTLIIFALLIAGIVGSARLYLGAHKKSDVYGGYLVGVFGQLVAFMFLATN